MTDSGDGGEGGGDELPCATEGEGDELSIMIIHTKFEVDMTISCPVTALLMLIRYVTLTFDLLILDSTHAWRVTW